MKTRPASAPDRKRDRELSTIEKAARHIDRVPHREFPRVFEAEVEIGVNAQSGGAKGERACVHLDVSVGRQGRLIMYVVVQYSLKDGD